MSLDPQVRGIAVVPGAPLGLAGVFTQLRGKAVVSPDTPAGVVEQYRRVAATLHKAQRDGGTKVVMIASAMPGEGKTLTATNLALTLSEAYRRKVLILDADLRRPQMHDIFQLPAGSGLSEALVDGSTAALGYPVSSQLTVVPAGKPTRDPIGGLTSPLMRDLVRGAADGFDWVIIDTPPVGLLSDANALTHFVDAVIMVVASGRVPFRIVRRSIDALGAERIIGVVLNRAPDASFGGSAFAYGGDYYGTYGYPAS